MKKTCVWLIGSNATGKTTQAKKLHQLGNSKIINEGKEGGINYTFTSFGRIANLGKIQDTACCGTDILKTKDEISLSYKKALVNHDLVIVDGIMATGTWIDFLKRKDVYLILILLDTTIEENLKRLEQRRSKKESKRMSINTIENIAGKIKSFRSIFDRLKNSVNVSLKINIQDNNIDKTHEIILSKLSHLKFEKKNKE